MIFDLICSSILVIFRSIMLSLFHLFLILYLSFECWLDHIFILGGFGHAVCYKVNTQTDDPTKENVTECPAINGLPQYDVLKLVVLGLDSNTLPVQFFPLYLHYGRQSHIRIGLFLGGDGDGFCHTAAADGDRGVSTGYDGCTRTEQRGHSHNANKCKYFSHISNLFRLYISFFDFILDNSMRTVTSELHKDNPISNSNLFLFCYNRTAIIKISSRSNLSYLARHLLF